MDMKGFIISTVGVRIIGKALPITIEDIDNTSKSVNFQIDRGLYRKFEYVVGRGNVSKTIRKFMTAVVRKYERVSNFNFLGVKNGEKQRE